jgi:hypothetical protein
MTTQDVPDGARPFLGLLRRYHANETPHSGRHLVDHLVGTYRLLEAWGNPPEVCRAGLFHSIYGTNIFVFRAAGFDQRPVIRDAIGETAERLSYLFCSVDRPLALLQALIAHKAELTDIAGGGTLTLEAGELPALLEIEVANFLEQPEDRDIIAQIDKIIRAVDPSVISAAAAAALAAYLAA